MQMQDAAVLAPGPDTGPTPAEAAPPAWTVLCVDDEPNILSALRRLFRNSGHRFLSAGGGAQALEVLQSEAVDLVISDMRMPGMDGAQLLEQVRERWPRTVRLLLTGQADVSSTIAAINRGRVHRYITKPWNDDELLTTVNQSLEIVALEREKDRLEALTEQQNLALRELNAGLEAKVEQRTEELSRLNHQLKKNYLTSIKVFSNLIELRGGLLVGHSRRVADLARRTAVVLGLPDSEQQDIFIAGLLHDIGQIGLSDELLSRSVPRMNPEEKVAYRRHAVMGEQALMALEDMQRVALLVRHHHERHDGMGFPDGLKGDATPLGARILAVADTYDDLLSGHLGANGLKTEDARTIIHRGRGTQFDDGVVEAFLRATQPQRAETVPPLRLVTAQLRPGMVLARELRSAEGVLLLAADHVLTADMILRIAAHERRAGEPMEHLVRPAKA